jgi:hypothetical protein
MLSRQIPARLRLRMPDRTMTRSASATPLPNGPRRRLPRDMSQDLRHDLHR